MVVLMIMLVNSQNKLTLVPSEVEGDGTIMDFFATTVIMPTYLIAFAIQVLIHSRSSTIPGLWFCGGSE